MNIPQNKVTIVTAFFDINREEKGDGRRLEEYMDWIQKTLKLNCSLFVVTEEKFRHFFMVNRLKPFPTNMRIHVMDFKESHYYKYYDRMKEIVEDPIYKSRIAYPDRVECKMPEYSIIQYSKFHYLQLAIDENPFQSTTFFWMDAGASRFFTNTDISKPFPSPNGHNILSMHPHAFFAQQRPDLQNYQFDENFLWKADNLIYGGMFGGNKDVIQEISKMVEQIFVEELLDKGIVNNEQLVLALVWKKKPHLFALCVEPRSPMFLFKILSST
jgi:hypothetical protein